MEHPPAPTSPVVSAAADPAVDAALGFAGCPRDEAVDALLDAVDWRREPLERARDALIRRLDRRSDDFEASNALRLVYEALTRVGWPDWPSSGRPSSRRGGGHRRERGSLRHLRAAFRR